MRKILRFILWVFVVVAATGLSFVLYASIAWRTTPPHAFTLNGPNPTAEIIGTNTYTCGNSWMRKNQYGIWEMYLEGSPIEIGAKRGALSHNLIELQEGYFIDQIKQIIPSEFYLRFLKYFIAWFNRDLEKNIPEEYLREMYGLSLYAPDKFSYIGNNYERILHYHSAHDIGHAMQDYMLVGCTSFASWGKYTPDSSLTVGRNFDFYVGDDFAKDKIVCFIKPDKGYQFAMITWAAMVGVSSGINEKGLTVTINAAKSKPPTASATPISILAREILQYAGTIEEARAIASKRKIFVSESLLIASAADGRAAIIEKSPHQSGFFQPDRDFVVCANHFQSKVFETDPLNLENIEESSSMSRYQRMTELIETLAPISPRKAAVILRDRMGPGGSNIGMGNEKSINQFIAHHSIIFKPEQKQFWLATKPWQMGPYICYNMDSIFSESNQLNIEHEIIQPGKTIEKDPFLQSEAFKNYLKFRVMKKIIKSADKPVDLPVNNFQDFIKLNPEYFLTYQLVGDYYMKQYIYDSASFYYKKALNKCISNKWEREMIEKNLNKCQ